MLNSPHWVQLVVAWHWAWHWAWLVAAFRYIHSILVLRMSMVLLTSHGYRKRRSLYILRRYWKAQISLIKSHHSTTGWTQKSSPPPATFVDISAVECKFLHEILRDYQTIKYTLYHQVWLKYIGKWQNYAVSKTTQLSQCASVMQNWLNANGFIEKTEWPTSSPGLNPVDCHIWGTMLLLFSYSLSLSPPRPGKEPDVKPA